MTGPGAPSERPASCLCGAVKLGVSGEPITFKICHCLHCQKLSGSAFMAGVFYKVENVHIRQGEDHIRHYEEKSTASGNPLRRSFCENCGSKLLLQVPGDNIVGVFIGAVDGPQNWVPRKELWPVRRRSWLKEIEMHPHKSRL